MRAPRPILIVLGALLALTGLGLLAAGIGLTWAHTTQRDADGFYTSPSYELRSDGYALATQDLPLVTRPEDWFPDPGDLRFRVTISPAEPTQSVFVGLAPAADVAAYLDGVPHDRLVHVGIGVDDVDYETVAGTSQPTDPVGQAMWVASIAGVGTQTLTVDAAPGDWALVVMNTDRTPGVAVTATAGVASGLLLPIGIGLLVAAVLLLAGAAGLLVAGAGRIPPAEPDDVVAAQGPYPVTLTGTLDPQLSRGLWLLKWVLVLPHLVVLAVLWAAFVVLTVGAGIAILFTGRYPEAIFDFNVGVMRWTWRVSYYAFGVLGTDRYPPFTLAHDPTYPATLDVAHPQELSRGLVLVKWWLLAIPHYLIVAIFTGGLLGWTLDAGPGGTRVVISTGLVGVLVLAAAIVLLFTGRYPPGLYDLVMGLQRWVYRVTAYVTLMTDEYPPFRLDTGGTEPPAPDRDRGPMSGSGSDLGQRHELPHT